ncbi:hypothetical protein CB1_000092006 [Camelus ferus]|nr:hypothetical protein CB1_000092006 [Camelus ferus]
MLSWEDLCDLKASHGLVPRERGPDPDLSQPLPSAVFEKLPLTLPGPLVNLGKSLPSTIVEKGKRGPGRPSAQGLRISSIPHMQQPRVGVPGRVLGGQDTESELVGARYVPGDSEKAADMKAVPHFGSEPPSHLLLTVDPGPGVPEVPGPLEVLSGRGAHCLPAPKSERGGHQCSLGLCGSPPRPAGLRSDLSIRVAPSLTLCLILTQPRAHQQQRGGHAVPSGPQEREQAGAWVLGTPWRAAVC